MNMNELILEALEREKNRFGYAEEQYRTMGAEAAAHPDFHPHGELGGSLAEIFAEFEEHHRTWAAVEEYAKKLFSGNECYQCKRLGHPGPIQATPGAPEGLSYRCYDCGMLFCLPHILQHCNTMTALHIRSTGTGVWCRNCKEICELTQDAAEITDHLMRGFIHKHRDCRKKEPE